MSIKMTVIGRGYHEGYESVAIITDTDIIIPEGDMLMEDFKMEALRFHERDNKTLEEGMYITVTRSNFNVKRETVED